MKIFLNYIFVFGALFINVNSLIAQQTFVEGFHERAVNSIVEGQVTKLSPQVKSLVKKIKNENRIDSEDVGYSAEKTELYQKFILLTSLSSIDELIKLSRNENAVIRGYAFWALAKRYFEGLEKIYLEHKKDNKKVTLFYGCFIEKIPLNEFMTLVITSDVFDLNCKKLYFE